MKENIRFKEIDYLIVGNSNFNPSDSSYTNIKLNYYPTDTVAFFPNHINNDWLEIVSFKRILGFLYDIKMSNKQNFSTVTLCNNPKSLALKLRKKRIYFCNLVDIQKSNSITFPKNNFILTKTNGLVWKISDNTKILCFGSDPIKEMTKKVIENNLPFENLSTFPHPAKNNNHIIWQHFDNEFEPTTYNLKLKNSPKL